MKTRMLDFGDGPPNDDASRLERLRDLKRLREAPTRHIFTIPVGHLSPKEAMKTVKELSERFKRVRFRN